MPTTVTVRTDAAVGYRRAQPRDREDERAVGEIAAHLREGGETDPVIVFEDGAGARVVADGHHRLRAHARAGREEIRCEIRAGDYDAALEYGVTVGRRNNLVRWTREDTRSAIRKLLLSSKARSSRAIGELVGASHHTVEKIRSELTAPGQSAHLGSPCTVTGRDGKSYPVATRPIVPPRAPAPEPPLAPRQAFAPAPRPAKPTPAPSGAPSPRPPSAFTCPDCGEGFGERVWHCPVCAHHWDDSRADCWNCHAYTRPERLGTGGVARCVRCRRAPVDPKAFAAFGEALCTACGLAEVADDVPQSQLPPLVVEPKEPAPREASPDLSHAGGNLEELAFATRFAAETRAFVAAVRPRVEALRGLREARNVATRDHAITHLALLADELRGLLTTDTRPGLRVVR